MYFGLKGRGSYVIIPEIGLKIKRIFQVNEKEKKKTNEGKILKEAFREFRERFNLKTIRWKKTASGIVDSFFL